MIRIKERYQKGNVQVPLQKLDMKRMRSCVDFYQERLNIVKGVLITFKCKQYYLDNVVAVTFDNKATDGISIHVFVHRHTIEKCVFLALAHELVHAHQLDNGKDVSEEEADKVGLTLCRDYYSSLDNAADIHRIELELILCRTYIN